MPGVAAKYASNSQPTAFDRAMFFYRLTGELRACRRETTLIAHKGGQHKLVKADQADQ